VTRARRAVPCALAGLLALASLTAPAPGADRREDLEALRRAIDESRERVEAYERQERGLLETVEALDRAVLLLSRDVAGARRAARAARRELATLEGEAREAEARVAATRRAMRARSVALYRAGELGSVRVLFSAQGLPEFLTRVSALQRLLTNDARLLARHRLQSEALELARADARASATRLAEAESELARRSAELQTERSHKRRLVARLHQDRTREREALVELETAARALEETLARLDAGAAGPELPVEGPPFLALRGRLDPPVEGPVLRDFGRAVDAEFRTETFHSGLDFGAALGTPVEAVTGGRVRFAGWFRGYGRLVILDHGDRYFTVSGHLEELAVGVGDTVAQRQQIGTVGETGSLSGPRLYFEIRRGGEALDPQQWLREATAR
jgi:septal ring factor EnvC (AmiA/AmiB activator)